MIRGVVLASLVAVSAIAIPATPSFARDGLPISVALRVVVPDLDLKDAPLEKVIDKIRDLSGGNITVNWKALEGAGITKDTPITLRIGDISVRRAINLVLDEASATAQTAILVDGGVARITTQADADAHMVTVLYPVGDLILPKNTTLNIPNFTNMNQVNNNNGNNNNITGGGTLFNNNNNNQGGLFGGANNNNNNNQNNGNNGSVSNYFSTKDDKSGQALMDLLIATVRPEIWDKNGGKATMKLWDTTLVVTAPISVQEALGGAAYTTQNRRYGW